MTLPKDSELRLSSALALPSVGILGVMDGAPHSTPLVEYLREHVSDVEAPGLKEATAGRYLPLKVTVVETRAPSDRDQTQSEDAKKPN